MSPISATPLKIIALRTSYLCAAAATAAMGWLAGSGALGAMMTAAMQSAAVPTPSFATSFYDELRIPQVLLCACFVAGFVYLAFRPHWWGKPLCALAAVVWIGFSVQLGLVGGWQPTLKWVLGAGCVMLVAAIMQQIADPGLGYEYLRKLRR